MKISTFTTMTKPEERLDPWKEAIKCYESFSDEVVVVGEDWPTEFKFDLIGKYYQKGFDECSGDWVLRMDVDYFFHENDSPKLNEILSKYSNYPAVSLPQYQFFTPERYQIKTRLCIALNKKKYPEIKFNGGGDLCLPTLNNKIIDIKKVPNVNIPIYQYDSMFRTKEIISEDRARFARAWYRQFNSYGDRGGPEPDEAFKHWYKMIQKKYYFHIHKIKLENHPKVISDSLLNLKEEQFGYSAFGLKDTISRPLKNYLKGYKEKYFNPVSYTHLRAHET